MTGTDRRDEYLAEVAARLRGPRRRSAAVIDELRDGLDQAVTDDLARGHTADEAIAAAIDQFGEPRAVADAFAGELATAYARRTIALYLLSGPMVGIWWLLLLRPQPWRVGLVALLAAIPVLPLIALAVVTGAGTLATTGRLMPWLPETTPHRALAATKAIACLALIGDITLITMLAASGGPARPVATIAFAGSLIRITASVLVLARVTRLSHARG
jgi:hypothetical protein